MLEKYKEIHFGLSQEIHRKNIVCEKKNDTYFLFMNFFLYGMYSIDS